MKRFQTLLVSSLALFAVSCSSTRYADPRAEETVNIDWGSTDLQTFSSYMADSLIQAPQLSYMAKPYKGDDMRIVTYMGGIANETSEHVNTKDVGRLIRVDLVNSGKFRFVAGDQGQAEIGDQVRFQQGSGRVAQEQAIAFGRQLGAEMVIYGAISSIEKKKGRSIETVGAKTKDTYYLFTLNAVNIETGEIIWTQAEDIRKTARIGLFGSE